MKVTYDYIDARTGPPANYEVEVESDLEAWKLIQWLVSLALNGGETTYRMELATGIRPDYHKRYEVRGNRA